jgi:hypothetical protein
VARGVRLSDTIYCLVLFVSVSCSVCCMLSDLLGRALAWLAFPCAGGATWAGAVKVVRNEGSAAAGFLGEGFSSLRCQRKPRSPRQTLLQR